MSEIDQILSQVPMDQVAAALGVDQSQAKEATRTAIPALLGGMQANAQDADGAASLVSALQNHSDTALSGNLDAIDTRDGQKIVDNIFGGQTSDVVARLGGTGQASSGIIQKLLPILAPIVMAYLAKKLTGSGGLGGLGATGTSNAMQDPMGGLGGGLGSILGSLGGGSAGGAQGGLGDLLGQVLGGAGGAQTQPGTPSGQAGQGGMGDLLGGVLGGLLGGGKR